MTQASLTITPDSRKPKPWWYIFCAKCHWRRAQDMPRFTSFSSSTHRRMRQHYICPTCYERHNNFVDAIMWRSVREWAEPMQLEKMEQKYKLESMTE